MEFYKLTRHLTYFGSGIAKIYVLRKSHIAEMVTSFIDEKLVKQYNGNKISDKRLKTLLEKDYRRV